MGYFTRFFGRNNTLAPSDLDEEMLQPTDGTREIPINDDQAPQAEGSSKFKIALRVVGLLVLATGATTAAVLLARSSKDKSTCPSEGIPGNLVLRHGTDQFFYNATSDNSMGQYIPPNMTTVATLPCWMMVCAVPNDAIKQEKKEFFGKMNSFIDPTCSGVNNSDPQNNLTAVCNHYVDDRNYTIPDCDQPTARSCPEILTEILEAQSVIRCRERLFYPDPRAWMVDSENDTINGMSTVGSVTGEMTSDVWTYKAMP